MTFRFLWSVSVAMTGPRVIGSRAPHSIAIGFVVAWRITRSIKLPIERAVLIGVLLPVLAAELLNSAIEVLVDKLWPGHDELAGRAKDLGSAAVFVCMVNLIVVWAVLLWPDVAIGR